MIGNPDSVDLMLDGGCSVLRVHNPLEDDLELGVLLNSMDVFPAYIKCIRAAVIRGETLARIRLDSCVFEKSDELRVRRHREISAHGLSASGIDSVVDGDDHSQITHGFQSREHFQISDHAFGEVAEQRSAGSQFCHFIWESVRPPTERENVASSLDSSSHCFLTLRMNQPMAGGRRDADGRGDLPAEQRGGELGVQLALEDSLLELVEAKALDISVKRSAVIRYVFEK